MMYVLFQLSLRNVEDLLHKRDIDVSHDAARYCWHRFGPLFAAEIRKRWIKSMKSSFWRWHLDKLFVKTNGERHYLGRAVDHEGEALESFVTKTRDKRVAIKFLKKTMRKHGRPEVIVTDKLLSQSPLVERFYGRVITENSSSIYNYKKLGFRMIGHDLRSWRAPSNDELLDTIHFEFLATDWRKKTGPDTPMTSTEAATQLLASALGISEAEISDETSITYSDEWDSLAHFGIIFALEEQIDRKMSPLEIFELSNFESVVEILARR